MEEAIIERLKKVKMVIFDSDGVLTDGRLIYDDKGSEMVVFDVKDGFGVRALVESGLIVAVISGRASEIVRRRAELLGVKEIYTGVKEKRNPYRELLKKYRLEADEVVYVADDVYDLPLMKEVGISVAVADGAADTIEEADYVTKKNGGRGAVREIAEMVLRAKGLWQKVVDKLFDERREDNL